MRFNDILEANISTEAEVLDMYHKIYQNCQPYLQQIDNKPSKYILYRGIKHQHVDDKVGIKDVRLTNRRPQDVGQETHNSINLYFTQQYGHPYRNALFASGSSLLAESYGKPYAIFPIGKFEYIWHRQLRDLFSDFADGATNEDYFHYWVDFAEASGITINAGDDDTEFLEFQKDTTIGDLLSFAIKEDYGPYKQDNLKVAISIGNTEIMIWVQQYYYLDPTYVSGFESWLTK